MHEDNDLLAASAETTDPEETCVFFVKRKTGLPAMDSLTFKFDNSPGNKPYSSQLMHWQSSSTLWIMTGFE